MSAKSNPKRAAVYARTSVDDKQGVSIAQQVEDGKKLVEKNGWILAGVYIDQDIKGTLPPRQWADGRRKIRPALSDLLDAIVTAKVDVVVTRKLDRLSRARAEEQHKLLSHFEQNGIGLACTHDSIPDISSASGELSLTMLLAISRYEWRKIRDNIKASKDYQRLHGLKHSGAGMLGYKDATDTNNKKIVVIDETKATIVREIFEMASKGKSIYEICERLKIVYPRQTYTGRQWQQQTIKGMLLNPKYIGMESYNGELRKSLYPAIIDMDTWGIVAERFKHRQPKQGKKTQLLHLMSGLLRCAYCGEKLVLMLENRQEKLGKNKPYRYYCCPFKHQDKKDKPVVVREEEWLRVADTILSTAQLHTTKQNEKSLQALQKIELVKKRYKEALKLYAIGDIDKEALDIIKQESTAIQMRLQGDLAGGKTSSSIVWEKANLMQRRTWLMSTVTTIEVFKHGAVINFSHDAYFKVDDTGMQFKQFYLPSKKIQVREKTRPRNALLPLSIGLIGAKEYKLDGIGSIWGLDSLEG